MTTVIVGPWRPEEETLQEYLHRLAHSAPEPSPEQYTELAALLPLGPANDREGSESQ